MLKAILAVYLGILFFILSTLAIVVFGMWVVERVSNNTKRRVDYDRSDDDIVKSSDLDLEHHRK